MEALALTLIVIGGLTAVVGFFWMLITAFNEGPLWGLGLLVPILSTFVLIAFLVKFWEAAKKPFLLNLGGGLVVILGLFSMPGSALGWPGSEPEPAFSGGAGTAARPLAPAISPLSDASAEGDTALAPRRPPVAGSRPVAGSPGSSEAAEDAPSAPSRPAGPREKVSHPVSDADQLVGRVVEVIKTNGDRLQVRLLGVGANSLEVSQGISGGSVRFTLPKSVVAELQVYPGQPRG